MTLEDRQPDPEIQIDRLSKHYGDRIAVDRLSLSLSSGSVCCLLGRNGAGKTTTIQTIMGLRNPTSGDVRIRGTSVSAPAIHSVRRSVGYLPETPILYPHLTGREFLAFVGALHGAASGLAPRTEAGMERLGIASHADASIRTFSQGSRKKLAFLAAILHDPPILILDEPTAALDAVGARAVKEIMQEYRDRGRLVLFTTHVLDIAERVADRIVILREGSLRFDGSLAELRRIEGASAGVPLEELFLRMTAPAASAEARASAPTLRGPSSR